MPTLLTPKLALASGSALADVDTSALTDLASREGLMVAKTIGLSLGLLFVGWILARLVGSAVTGLLKKTSLDQKIAAKLGMADLAKNDGRLEHSAGRVAYWIVLLMVIVAVLQYAGLTQAATPLQQVVDSVGAAIPSIGKAALILLVAYVVGRGLSFIVEKALGALALENRLADLENDPEKAPKPIGKTVGRVAFSLVMIIGLAGAFDALKITPISVPLNNAIDTVVGALPSVVVAAVIAGIGWILGRIVRAVVRNLLEAVGFDGLTERIHIRAIFGKRSPSDVVGIIAMAFIVLQAAIAALGELGLETLSVPLTDMMGQFWTLLPALLVAAVIVGVGVVVGRIAGDLVAHLLHSVKFDALLARFGFEKVLERDDALGRPSELVGRVVRLAILLVAVSQALAHLELGAWAGYLDALLTFAVQRVLPAVIILAIGFGLAGHARSFVNARKTAAPGKSAAWLGEFARYAILVFATTMALNQLGVAQQFVLLAFGLLFGALCLALALSFGLGGREVAGDFLQKRYRGLMTGGPGVPAPRTAAAVAPREEESRDPIA